MVPPSFSCGVVFDATIKHVGKSLNNTIRPGPKLQREVVDVLATRFRRVPVALTAGISEMFLHVGLQEKDRPYNRFFWRDFNTSREPDVYEFQRPLFGKTAPPFCSQYVLHTCVQAHTVEFPEAAECVDNSMYVDDVRLKRDNRVLNTCNANCLTCMLAVSYGRFQAKEVVFE